MFMWSVESLFANVQCSDGKHPLGGGPYSGLLVWEAAMCSTAEALKSGMLGGCGTKVECLVPGAKLEEDPTVGDLNSASANIYHITMIPRCHAGFIIIKSRYSFSFSSSSP